MVLHNNPSFAIYLGDSNDCCVKSNCLDCVDYFLKLQKNFKLKKIILLKQIHSSLGLCIKDIDFVKSTIDIFRHEGDFLVTNVRLLGLGVLTADCLPIIFYDPKNHVIGIAHAGWRGSVNRIVSKVIDSMKKNFNSNVQDLIIYFGSCAKVCCYEVKEDFLENLEDFYFYREVIIKKENKIFFDLAKFNKLLLLDLGVKLKNINNQYNNCTICNSSFFSHRKDKLSLCRQTSIVALK